MINRIFIFLIAVSLAVACNDKVADDGFLDGEYIGFNKEVTLGSFLADGSGTIYDPGIEVRLIAPHKDTDTKYNFIVVDSLTTAIENVDYRLSSESGVISANSSFETLPIEILPDNIDPTTSPILTLRLVDADIQIAENFKDISYKIIVASCPVGASDFTGDYAITYLDNQVFAAIGASTFGPDGTVVNLTNAGGNLRSFNFVHLQELAIMGQGAVVLSFDLDCGEVIPINLIGTNLSCDMGATEINIGPAATFSFYSAANDSSFEMTYNTFESGFDGGCGTDPFTEIVLFTKQ